MAAALAVQIPDSSRRNGCPSIGLKSKSSRPTSEDLPTISFSNILSCYLASPRFSTALSQRRDRAASHRRKFTAFLLTFPALPDQPIDTIAKSYDWKPRTCYGPGCAVDGAAA